MIAMSPEEEKIIAGIIAEFAPDCNVYAYGSRVKGTNGKTSDLDLAFALPNGAKLPFTRLGDIKYAFSESDLIFRVDVLDYNGVEEHFRKIIDRERLEIVGVQKGR
ncbi:MAG: nucleotidyltransferase domain-containing protein [Chitinispirillales bacterium]|jgi:predicted nucleotidyltransferase|nr:nucleotidyltransferase domain-containing protein [Chitinispirillales bacterium]